MAINYSNNPQNIVTSANEPFFQDWSPQPSVTNYFWSNLTPALLIPGLIVYKIKDVINNPQFGQFSSFRLKQFVFYAGNTQTVPFLLSTSIAGLPANNQTVPITQNGMSFNFLPVFQNLALQQVGVYDFRRQLTIEGRNSSGNWVDVSYYEHIIRLNVSNVLVEFSPQALQFQHTKNTPLPSQNLTVSGADWAVQAQPNFSLSSSDPAVTIQTINPSSGSPYQIATGSGTAVVEVTLTSFWDVSTLNDGTYSHFATVLAQNTVISNVPISVVLVSANSFYAGPLSLEFYGVKGIQEPERQSIFVFCSSSPYEISTPPWLTVVNTLEPDPLNLGLDGYWVQPIPTQNMEPGEYNGTILLTDTVNGNLLTIAITVKYILEGFVTSPYQAGEKAFTLDPLYFNFSTTNIDTYMQVEASIRAFAFFNGQEKTNVIFEKIPLFQGRAKANYGKSIHGLMARFNQVNENLLQYKPAQLSLLVKEVELQTGNVLREAFLQNLQFVAGISNGSINQNDFLNFNKKPARVTINSSYIFNIIASDEQEYKLRILKNNELHEDVFLGFPFGQIMSKKYSFSAFSPGDVIDVVLFANEVPENAPTKRFYILPEGKYSWEIFWENEFLLQSVLEFTGILNCNSDFEHRQNNVFQNLVEVLEYVETTKVAKININTGFILESQIDDIESLLRSKRVWLTNGDKKISLRPISKKILSKDTERELIDFTMEFQINRNHDQETYSF